MIESLAKFVENTLSKNPLVMIGSGSSLGAGISGMGKLATWLINNVNVTSLNQSDIEEWETIKHRLIIEGMGLEQSLQSSGSRLSSSLTKEIVEKTWCCIANDERNSLINLSIGEDVIGMCRLFERLKHTTNNVVHIVTTNYDHLIEWSAAAAEWQVWDGFDNGTISRPLLSYDLSSRMSRVVLSSRYPSTAVVKHVRVYKPHGSLSWFKDERGNILRISNVTYSDYDYLKSRKLDPVIVTPGLTKYLETHFEPYNTVMAEMQSAIRRSSSLVFLGFGFNDEHIQASFISHLRNNDIPKVILARTLSDSFHKIRLEGQIRNYIAIEECGKHSRVYSDKFVDDEYPVFQLWSLKGLLNLAWGED